MKTETKRQVYIFGYCSILWLTNWSVAHTYDRTNGFISSSTDLRGFGILFSVIASFVLAKRVWKLLRKILDSSIRVPLSLKLWGEWKVLWLLLPLFFGYVHHSHGTAKDGAAVHTVYEYGGEPSAVLFFFAATTIMLFQLLVRLEMLDPDRNGEDVIGNPKPS